MKKSITNWNLYPVVESNYFEPQSISEIQNLIKTKNNVIARGNGKSYGDCSLSENIISSRYLNKIISFDKEKGIIKSESGVLLSEILNFIIPYGYFLPVTPGTKYITIGGAFASDVHGKNHHINGVFSDHVCSLKLINEFGDIIYIKQNDDLFIKTAGGMGLTGFILEIELKLRKIETSFIKQHIIIAKNLDEIFDYFEKYKFSTYSVAWIDSLSKNNIGKSILMIGEHAKSTDLDNLDSKLILHTPPKFKIPNNFPSFFLNYYTIKLFNYLFYNFNKYKSKHSIIHYDNFFYPLDKIENWNKIYGKSGFIQYQFVIPKSNSKNAIIEILNFLNKNNLASFLSVLKLFGKSHENRYLNFPIEGYTIALDIKLTPKLFSILDILDKKVTDYGGKIYLAKDCRLSNSYFKLQYPNQVSKNFKFNSFQSIRLNKENLEVFLVIGANSDIAKSIILKYLKINPHVFLLLAGRNIKSIENFVIENNFRHRCKILYYDISDINSTDNFINNLPYKPTWVLYAAGVYYNNDDCQKIENFNEMVTVNYLGAINIINKLVNDNNPYLKRITGISSIAALRGRQSNYMYGSTKSGFHQYFFGLRQALNSRNINVQVLTPGIVKTKLIKNIQIPKIALNPNVIAESLFKNSKDFEIYPNFLWYSIAKIVKFAPQSILKKL